MASGGALPLRMDPEALGPLGDRPLVESAPQSSPDDLFPGASAFLSRRQQEKTRRLSQAVAPRVQGLLEDGETILFASHAMQVAPILHMMSLGYLARAYHQVMLVFTSARLIEILLDFRGKNPESRIRSYPWADARDIKMRFRSLTVKPVRGRKQTWTVSARGDRKLLKSLLPRLAGRLWSDAGAEVRALPIWHCPQCGAGTSERPAHCASCGTRFRSAGLAAWLSLAFPGAGLMYSGNPVLAAGDFIGEMILFVIVLAGLATASDTGSVVAMSAFGLFLFVITKAESIHLSHIFTVRTRPEAPERRERYRRFGMAGGALSAVAILGAFLVVGTLQEVVDRDLEIATADGVWAGSRSIDEWPFFAEDPAARSQWTHRDGLIVTVFAYPLGGPQEQKEFRQVFNENMKGQGQVVLEDDAIPGDLEGFRHVQRVQSPDGTPLAAFNYFVFDPEGKDVHQFFAAVDESRTNAARRLIDDLITRASWVAATPPVRQAGF